MARMDEFDWLTEINRASIVTNLRSGLINHSTAVMAADALRGVVSDVESGKSPRAKRVILYEPLLIAKAGPEVTVIHAGRSSQDMHSTFRLAMLRSATLDLMETLDGTLDDLALFARVPLLRHGGRNISVVASFRKKEPGAGLRVLRHDAADHFPDMETDRGYDAGEFHREINLRNLGRVKSVTPRPVKPEEV